MLSRFLKQFIICGSMIIAAPLASATTPGLWDGAAATPPESIWLPDKDMVQGSFEYVSLSPVYFEDDGATLTHEGQQALNAASEYLQKHDNIKRILIESHADDKGSAIYNDKLSDRRATIVRNYLTIKGIDSGLINLSSMGEHQPVDQNWTRAGRQRNRHVSIYAIHWTR